MTEEINEPIRVLAGFDHTKRASVVLPYLLDWRGHRYKVTQFGIHYPARRGKKFYHIFELLCDTVKFKLELDTETLIWNLTEIYYDR